MNWAWHTAALVLGLGLAAAESTTAAAAGGQQQRLSALVIGIDAYRHAKPLAGAVNDARDLAETLKKAGARDVRLLVDGQADRDTILRSWNQLVAGSQPGDLLILTYAGHGAQSPELVIGSEEDGLDEYWVLAEFDPQGPAVHQRILDDDVAAMMAKASHLNVLMISDSCHSGTMTRSLDLRAEAPSVRATTFGPLDDDPLMLPDPEAAAKEIDDFDNVTFFAAVPDHQQAPEITIDNRKRGALSWSFARALEGNADRDGDGRTTKDELERFVRENVRMKVAGLQSPQVIRGGTGSDVALPTGLPRPPTVEPTGAIGRGVIPLLVINPGSVPVDTLYQALEGVRRAEPTTPGRYTWDVGRGEVISDQGDLIAVVKSDRLEHELVRVQGVIEKWRVLAVLQKEAQRRSLQVRLEPSDRRYTTGDRVTFVVGGRDLPYFLLFNLSSDGTVNYLYPMRGDGYDDPPQLPPREAFRLPLEVTPPFGAEHIVAVASDQPLDALAAALKAVDGDQESAQIPDLFKQHLAGRRTQIGLHGAFSAPR